MKNEIVFSFIKSVSGHTFVGLTTETKVDLKISTALRSRVTKLTICQYGFWASYENAVNNHLAKAGNDTNFASEPLKWGQWVNGMENRVIEHKGNYYLRVYVTETSHPHCNYLVDGRMATEDEIAEIKANLYAKSSGSAKQAAAGLETHQVKPKDLKFESILEIRHNGMTYCDEVREVG